MKFAFSVAFKYLIPRWRQLSVSVISVVSIFVVALVVWLVLVFLSVTNGIEKGWIEKLIAFNAPLQLTPTDAYYNSYYYQVDSISQASQYSHKSLGEKLASPVTDPYDPNSDVEVPTFWATTEGTPPKDIVKETYAVITSLPDISKMAASDLRINDFEVAFSNMRLRLVRGAAQTFITQASYLTSLDALNPKLQSTLIPPTSKDLSNILTQAPLSGKSAQEDAPNSDNRRPQAVIDQGLQRFYSNVIDGAPTLTFSSPPDTPPLWSYVLSSPNNKKEIILPSDLGAGQGVLVAKNFKSHGVLVGDRGYLSYYAPTASSVQELRIPIYVAGFYDPGITPLGGRFVLVNKSITSLIRATVSDKDKTMGNGFQIWIDDFNQAENAKKLIEENLEKKGLASYWQVQTFREYEFSKDILQQLQSDKMLFVLIAIIIIIVACSNIISMLILLVNDKKMDIGILQSMGASPWNIGAIFGICGFTMGILSSALGTVAAIFTLHNLQSLVHFLSAIQGHDAFQASFYGDTLPNELSYGALGFVLITTIAFSVLAGLVPAIKASLMRPAAILRSE